MWGRHPTDFWFLLGAATLWPSTSSAVAIGPAEEGGDWEEFKFLVPLSQRNQKLQVFLAEVSIADWARKKGST